MDYSKMEYVNQTKLTKSEWNGMEVPISRSELEIMNMIQLGFATVDIKVNNTPTIVSYLKLSNITIPMHLYLFKRYLGDNIEKINLQFSEYYGKMFIPLQLPSAKDAVVKKADLFRIENANTRFNVNSNSIIEFIAIDMLTSIIRLLKIDDDRWMTNYYDINKLMKQSFNGFNIELRRHIENILKTIPIGEDELGTMIENGYDITENNKNLFKHVDEELYSHQKQLFNICNKPNSKLIFYKAPTGTGKTLGPIPLSNKHRIIFVCAARHVALALARTAISCHKRIAFAFGCNDAEDIRLHYYAAKEYSKHVKSGGIGKVDNSNGERVEIMISDIKSYMPAMLYMLAFNKREDIIWYWDEPTRTLDYAEHPLHDTIKHNWTNNLIPNIVLSSATIPTRNSLESMCDNFRERFPNADINEISSFDCKKTIPIINTEGYIEMPHYLYKDYKDILIAVSSCLENKSLLRYIDVREAIKFILFTDEHSKQICINGNYDIKNVIVDISCINMYDIKMLYLNKLGNIKQDVWARVYKSCQKDRTKRYNSVIHMTTSDAHTLTDGPTIYIADDVDKLAQECIRDTKIPPTVYKNIITKIKLNETVNEKIHKFEQAILNMQRKCSSTQPDSSNSRRDGAEKNDNESLEEKTLQSKIDMLYEEILPITLDSIYIPNTLDHLHKFNYVKAEYEGVPYISNISDETIRRIMNIHGVDEFHKLLLMMGVGVFTQHNNIDYTELIKQLASEQKMLVIFASPDYIYGTNYQFCHSYICDDLFNMSREKCIQAMGRVGRNNIQQTYSVRFRDDTILRKLFNQDDNQTEVVNMNKLFSGSI